MKRMIYLTVLLFALLSPIYAGTGNLDPQPAETGHRFYIGTNPLSYVAALQVQDNLKRYIPEAAGLEYGLSLIGGYFLNPHLSLESRLSWGNIHQVARIGQIHAGVNCFLFKNSNRWYDDFYIGAYLKFWDYRNKLTKVDFYNIAPYISCGHAFDWKPFIFDVRLNQTVAIYSWSNLEHSSAGADWFFSPWPEFIPVMPSFSFSLIWMF